MFILNTTNEYDSFTSCTENENDDTTTILKKLILSIPGGVLILCFINVKLYTALRHLLTIQKMETLL